MHARTERFEETRAADLCAYLRWHGIVAEAVWKVPALRLGRSHASHDGQLQPGGVASLVAAAAAFLTRNRRSDHLQGGHAVHRGAH